MYLLFLKKEGILLKVIKAAIIGSGFIGKQHIEAIRRIPGTTVAALVDTDP